MHASEPIYHWLEVFKSSIIQDILTCTRRLHIFLARTAHGHYRPSSFYIYPPATYYLAMSEHGHYMPSSLSLYILRYIMSLQCMQQLSP